VFLYPWHPWSGRQVHIHEVIEKGNVTVFRCSLSGHASDRWLEVPAWMFDRTADASWRIAAVPQVLHNRESGTLQYAMRDRLTALGWSRIETIDDDLGRSAAGGVARVGFDRMVAEVCLGKVGAVAAREVSRFARNSRDWQQLIEMCRVVDTVLIDQETVYAPRQGSDRLLLGLKGSLNEYELDLLRQRSLSARYRRNLGAGTMKPWTLIIRAGPEGSRSMPITSSVMA
tara:strand:- start:952 stop:1638 length:687 start_codon:yes stop_codon:yes gene_type:complete